MFDTIVSGFAGGAPREGYRAIWRDDAVRLLRLAALADDGQLRGLGRDRRFGRPANGIALTAGEDTVQVWFDADTHMPLAVERPADDAVLGPTVTRIGLSGWVRAGAIRLPSSQTVTVNGQLTQSLSLAGPQVNPSVDSVFDAIRKTAGVPIPTGVKIVDLAPGIYRAEASSPGGVAYNVLFAQLGDSIILVDPPVSDAYTKTVLDSIRARFPATPPRAFVVTHHHSDHLGGARAAFAAGMRAIAPAEIAVYVRNVPVAAGRKSAATRKVTAVTDTLAVGTGPSRFVLYHIPNTHARGLMMAYFPEAKLLAEVDLAGGPLQDRRDLYDFVQNRGLVVDRMARMHWPVSTWSSFVASTPGLPKK
jgi:glyoxylase-like metal-dependent hydrolase (beta-lactamase superfamily II)